MISSIKIQLEGYNFIKNENKKDYIDNLSKVNIFVGANNSGKSRFLRSLLTNSIFYHLPEGLNSKEISQVIEEIKDKIKEYLKRNNIKIKEIEQIMNTFPEFDYLHQKSEIHSKLESLEILINNMLNQSSSGWTNGLTHPLVGKELKQIYEKNINKLPKDILKKLTPEKYKFVYIPMLRGLRNLARNKEVAIGKEEITPYFEDWDSYRARTIFDYFNKKKLMKDFISNFNYNFEIFTGIGLYESIKKMLLGSQEQRDFIKEFQDFLSENFFDKKKITLIPRVENDVIYIKIGNDEERPIYNLGDGLHTLIITLFPLFKYQNENLILLIEEPELTLHPGMQRKLLYTYCKEFPYTQIFITTHSNHLLDLTLDFDNNVSIYSFIKNKENDFEISNITPNKQILNLLGIRNSSVFLSNCIIWVEGASDRYYLRKFLELYNEGIDSYIFEEDKHFSILEYGGGNITHFNFDEENSSKELINIQSISKNNFLIADNDGKGDYTTEINESDDDKIKRLKLFYKLLKNNFFGKHREIENLIPYKVYKKYFEDLPESSNRKWEYDSDKLNINEFNQEVKNDKIGKILKKHFIKLKENIEGYMGFKAEDISCIGNKKDIAKKLINVMDEEEIKFEDLPETAKELTKEVYKFIKSNNKD